MTAKKVRLPAAAAVSNANQATTKARTNPSAGAPLRKIVDMGVISAAEEIAALRAARKSGASLHILRFGDGVTALVTDLYPLENVPGTLSMPELADAQRQAYGEVGKALAKQIKNLSKHTSRRRAAAGKRR